MWKRRLTLKIKVFAWLLLRRCLITRSLRQCMVRDSPLECPHMFFACPFGKEVWQVGGVRRLVVILEEALWRSLSGGSLHHEAEWQNIFVTLWSLWTHKNEVIFRGCTPSADAIQHNAREFAYFCHRGGLGPSTIVPL